MGQWRYSMIGSQERKQGNRHVVNHRVSLETILRSPAEPIWDILAKHSPECPKGCWGDFYKHKITRKRREHIMKAVNFPSQYGSLTSVRCYSLLEWQSREWMPLLDSNWLCTRVLLLPFVTLCLNPLSLVSRCSDHCCLTCVKWWALYFCQKRSSDCVIV